MNDERINNQLSYQRIIHLNNNNNKFYHSINETNIIVITAALSVDRNVLTHIKYSKHTLMKDFLEQTQIDLHENVKAKPPGYFEV